MVGALALLPARDETPTSKKLPTVPIIAAAVTCQNEIPNPRKKDPYEIARKETFAAAQGQNNDRAFPLRSDSEIKLIPFSSKFEEILAIILFNYKNNYLGRLRRSFGRGRDFFLLPPPLDRDPLSLRDLPDLLLFA